MMNYPLHKKSTLQEVYEALDAIPANRFIRDKFWFKGRGCVLGHVQRLQGENLWDTKLEEKLRKAVSTFLKNSEVDIANINNRPYSMYNYTQKTPKGRVMAVLADMLQADVKL